MARLNSSIYLEISQLHFMFLCLSMYIHICIGMCVYVHRYIHTYMNKISLCTNFWLGEKLTLIFKIRLSMINHAVVIPKN